MTPEQRFQRIDLILQAIAENIQLASRALRETEKQTADNAAAAAAARAAANTPPNPVPAPPPNIAALIEEDSHQNLHLDRIQAVLDRMSARRAERTRNLQQAQ